MAEKRNRSPENCLLKSEQATQVFFPSSPGDSRTMAARHDRAALYKVSAVSISVCTSVLAVILTVVLELEGIGRNLWITLELVSLGCFLTAISLLIRDMTVNRRRGRK